MKLFQWYPGRQDSGYDKMLLFISTRFRFDFYLLKFPKGIGVPTHKDKVENGFNHHRVNFTWNGPYYTGTRMYVLGKAKRFWRFIYFRPDQYEHGLAPVIEDTYMLSLGWLTKSKSS